MRTPRALVAADARTFGRAARAVAAPAEQGRWGLSDDAQLFATSFAAGFLFVSILIG